MIFSSEEKKEYERKYESMKEDVLLKMSSEDLQIVKITLGYLLISTELKSVGLQGQ